MSADRTHVPKSLIEIKTTLSLSWGRELGPQERPEAVGAGWGWEVLLRPPWKGDGWSGAMLGSSWAGTGVHGRPQRWG